MRAANRLGATDTMERYLQYITNVTALAPDGHLQPVYGIRLQRRLDEREVTTLRGYRGMGPVRVGNAAYEQVQNDSYGSVINAVAQAFFDHRLTRRGTVETFRRLELVGEQAARRFDQPDAGVWEFRQKRSVHTYSSVMCWVACDRLRRIALRLGLADRAAYWGAHADRIRAYVEQGAWSRELRRFKSTIGGDESDEHDVADASLLLLHELGFLDAADPRFASTVVELERALRCGKLVLRYRADEMGQRGHRVHRVRLLVRRRAARARPRRAGARAVRAPALHAQPPRPAVRGPRPRDRRAVGELPTDLLDGRAHQLGDPVEQAVGRGVLAGYAAGR